MSTRILVPSGVLGLGFDQKALDLGVQCKPDIICIDGGSTDSGPYYLGTGTSKYSRAVCKSEWRQLMIARASIDVPLVITSSGTCGSDSMVEWMHDITSELATELGQSLKIARLYCEQSPQQIARSMSEGLACDGDGGDRIRALEPRLSMTTEDINEDTSDNHTAKTKVAEATHIVALGGAEQIQLALQEGADIVIAGRCTDTASIAALPLLRDEHPGACWHAAKIAECGALCSNKPTSGVILVDVDKNGFSVVPLAEDAACTPHSVSAHMLYENADPLTLYEPGGYLDVRDARYEACEYPNLTQAAVRVTGSNWVDDSTYTVKLEGARLVGYQVTQLAVLRDRHYVENATLWTDKLKTFLQEQIKERMAIAAADYLLDFRLIGQNSVFGELEQREVVPVEVGVLLIITAESSEVAGEIAKLANPFLLHYPLSEFEELPTFAFPYSPAESHRGALYEFMLNHVMVLDDPMDAFRLEFSQLGEKIETRVS